MTKIYYYRYEGIVQATTSPVSHLVGPDYIHPVGMGLSEDEAKNRLVAACLRQYEAVAAL